MKELYAEDPAQQINIYIVDTSSTYEPFYGLGYFPWCNGAMDTIGGVIIHWLVVGGSTQCGGFACDTLTHEIAHNLGLWHTQHGVSEVACCPDPPCPETAPCYEWYASDYTGDFCSDTPPTPRNYSCVDPGGVDPCGNPIGDTDETNFLGYGGDGCWNHFTSQQAGRMHCYTCLDLPSWTVVSEPGVCYRDGGESCVVTSSECCTSVSGVFYEGCSTCGTTGPCCLQDGSCVDVDATCCGDLGGIVKTGYSECSVIPYLDRCRPFEGPEGG